MRLPKRYEDRSRFMRTRGVQKAQFQVGQKNSSQVRWACAVGALELRKSQTGSLFTSVEAASRQESAGNINRRILGPHLMDSLTVPGRLLLDDHLAIA